MDDFSLVQTIDCFCHRIVLGVADTADGWLEACTGETLGVLYRQVLDLSQFDSGLEYRHHARFESAKIIRKDADLQSYFVSAPSSACAHED
jgi:hypothetical protein